jgi:hypothetical protein
MYQLAAAGVTRDADQEARRAVIHDDRQQAMREREAMRAAARAQTEAEIAARLEAAQAEEAEAAEEPAVAEIPVDAAPPAPEANEQQPQMIEESEAPALQAATVATPAEEEGEEPAARKIVKCRDKSGGVTFTQGYCPPGTRPVDMTSSE